MTTPAESTDPLLQPFRLGPVRLRNRVFSSSHAPGYNNDGTPSDRYIAYHVEKARGGVGMTMIGGSSNVSIDSASLWGQLDFGTDAVIEPLTRLVDEVHSHGTAVMTQLTHMGRRNVSNDGDWLPTVGPSPIREPMHRGWPKELDQFDIARIVADFAAAAVRAERSGLDGIELTATSHLIDQFWTPLANTRSDDYGGSLDNRLRFTMEVLAAIRTAVGDRLAVGIRMIGDEDQPGGLSRDESQEIAVRLAASGLLDFINVAGSSLATEEGLSKAIPPSGTPLMPYVPMAAAIKAAVDLPILHAQRIPDVATARHVLTEGFVDLVGMTRAHLADPHIVAKVERGEEDRIRVCVGASLCINRLHVGLDAICIQNPASGRELTIPQLVPLSSGPKRRAVVVGGGPGGLEAARVLAERGHQVVLIEARDRLGGAVTVAAMASARQRELLGIVDWLSAECERAGVDVRLGTVADVDTVQSLQPDIVITATGGYAAVPALAEGGHLVVTSEDVLSGHARVRGTVLVYDDHGSERAASVVEFLAGAAPVDEVELITPDRAPVQDLSATTGPQYLKMLYESGAVLTPDHRLVAVTLRPDEPDGRRLHVRLRNEYTRAEIVRHVDHVVVEHGVVPNDDLYRLLRPLSVNQGVVDLAALAGAKPQPAVARLDFDDASPSDFVLYRVGDAVSSRDIASAIFDSRRLCLGL